MTLNNHYVWLTMTCCWRVSIRDSGYFASYAILAPDITGRGRHAHLLALVMKISQLLLLFHRELTRMRGISGNYYLVRGHAVVANLLHILEI